MADRQLRADITRQAIVDVIGDEFSESMRAADVLDDDKQRLAVRVGLVVLYNAIINGVTEPSPSGDA